MKPFLLFHILMLFISTKGICQDSLFTLRQFVYHEELKACGLKGKKLEIPFQEELRRNLPFRLLWWSSEIVDYLTGEFSDYKNLKQNKLSRFTMVDILLLKDSSRYNFFIQDNKVYQTFMVKDPNGSHSVTITFKIKKNTKQEWISQLFKSNNNFIAFITKGEKTNGVWSVKSEFYQ